MVSDPCNAATGNEYQTEIDDPSSDGTLAFIRNYNSQSQSDTNVGFGWSALVLKHLDVSASTVRVREGSGRSEPFTCPASVGACAGDADTYLLLTKDASGYTLSRRAGGLERYDANGRLLAETKPNAQTTNYAYDATNRLTRITGPFGHVQSFSYSANHIASMTTPNGEVYGYAYDVNSNLTQVTYPDGSARRYHYENGALPHHLTGISHVESGGLATRYATFTYDATGRAVATEHTGGIEHHDLSYNSDTQTTVTDAGGVQEVMTFNANLGLKTLIGVVNPSDGKALNQTFDAQNNLTCKKDEEGRVTTYTYNSTNQQTSMTEGLLGSCSSPTPTSAMRTMSYQYVSGTLNLPTLIQGPSVAAGQSKTTSIVYGDSTHPNLPTSITQSGFTSSGGSVARTVALTYNSAGQVVSIDGPRTDVSDITTLAYNVCPTGGGCGQLQSITNALGQVTSFDSYDANGRLLQSSDPNGLRTNYSYDPRGRVASITQTPPSGSVRLTTYTYTAAGDVASVAFPDGRTPSYSYDAARLLRQVTDNLGNQIRYSYDLKGNRTQEATYDPTNTLVRQIDRAFDLRNHLASINAGSSITQQINDALGNLTQVTDPNANPPTQHQYDALNRLQQTINALGGNTSYGYNVQDKLTEVAAPNGASTQYLYDDLGNLLQESSPDRGTTTYTYDSAGNLTSQTDARGITAAYSYDPLNRLTAIRYGTGGLGGFLSGLFSGSPEDVTYTYDQGTTTPSNTACSFGIGRLCQISDASGVTQYAYDAFGNIATEAHTELNIIYTTRYSYDAADRIASITYPDGRIITYTRDVLGRIQSVNATVNNVTQAILSNRTYRADGLLTTQSFANGLTETRRYDLQGRLTSEFIGSADTRLYSYDPNGNLTQEQALAQVGAYTYDQLDRLTQENLTTTTTDTNAYTYDANGNRLSDLKNNGNVRPYTYEVNSNRLSQLGNQTLTLDAMGNTVSDRNENRTFTYTDAGRLAQVTIGGVVKGSYLYNALNQRTEKIKANQSFVYHYDIQGHLISESKANGNRIRAYLWADDQPIAQIQWNGNTKQEILVYLHTDHLNSPRLATDAAQTILWRWESEAFGTGRPDTDPDGDETKTNIRLRLAGQYADSESNLYYNWNRYYDPKSGRYITSDPIGLQGGLNTYSYALNNPLRYIDPTGLCPPILFSGWFGQNIGPCKFNTQYVFVLISESGTCADCGSGQKTCNYASIMSSYVSCKGKAPQDAGMSGSGPRITLTQNCKTGKLNGWNPNQPFGPNQGDPFWPPPDLLPPPGGGPPFSLLP